MFDLIREIGQTLKNNKLRTFLTGFAVAWGIFMLIILLGMARGVTNSFESNTNSIRSNTITVWGGNTSKPYKGYPEGRTINMRKDDREAILDDNENVSDAITSQYISNAVVSTSKDYFSAGLYGVYPKMQDMHRITMWKGRYINDNDLMQKRKTMVINKKNAELLFGDAEKAIGNTVNALGLSWTITGVYDDEWRDYNYIPYTTAKMLSGNNDRIYELQVVVEGLKTEKDGEEAEDAIRNTLSRKHEFAPDDKSATPMWNRFTSYLKNQEAFKILHIAIWLIGIFTLLSGIVGVSNIMFVSVRERTHEIGIRRAIGAKPRSILTQIVLESISITTLFGYIGIFFGMVVMQIISVVFADVEFLKDPTVDISIALKVTLVLILAGSLAGLFPAMKATKVKPVEALRDE
ncbi:MAG: ABC transporter permease [Muribaculaceae bacterium]|nr:ABC transporter permease [Muribaculaceae bacterium]